MKKIVTKLISIIRSALIAMRDWIRKAKHEFYFWRLWGLRDLLMGRDNQKSLLKPRY